MVDRMSKTDLPIKRMDAQVERVRTSQYTTQLNVWDHTDRMYQSTLYTSSARAAVDAIIRSANAHGRSSVS
jgi:hypothetical protein